jgi:hypothetical protein
MIAMLPLYIAINPTGSLEALIVRDCQFGGLVEFCSELVNRPEEDCPQLKTEQIKAASHGWRKSTR